MNDLFEQPRDSPSDLSPLPTCAKSVLRGPAVLIKRLIRVGLPAGLFTACPFAGHWLLRAVYSLTPFLPLPLERLGRSCHYAGDKRVISDSLEQTSDAPATHQRPSWLPLPTSQNFNCHNRTHFEALNDALSLMLLKVTACCGKLQISC